MKPLRERLNESIPEETAFENAKEFGGPAIRQGTWLTTPLWHDYAWGLKLKSAGVSWHVFMQAFGNVQYVFIRWRRDETAWDTAMAELIDEIIRLR